MSDEILLLAEGKLDSNTAERLRAHFSKCRPCYNTYSDLVRHRADWLLETGDRPPEALVARAKAMAGGTDTKTDPRESGSRRLKWAWVLVPAGAVMVAVWFWVWGTDETPSPLFSEEQRTLVTEVLGEASASGWILPGGRSLGESPEGSRYRSPGNATRADLDHAIRNLEVTSKNAGKQDLAVLLTGILVATNRLDEADKYLARDISRFPEDPRFLNTAAVIANRRRLPARADSLLGLAMRLDPEDPTTRLNLALLRKKQGRTNEAAELLRKVEKSAAGTPLGDRAAEELKNLESGP